MNILFISDHFLPKIAGGEFVVHYWAEGLVQRGHRVVVPQLYSIRNEKQYFKVNYEILYFPHIPFMYGLSRLVQMIRIAYGLKLELIHANFLYPAGHIGVLLQRMFDIPCLVSGHGADILTFPLLNYGNTMDPHVERLTKLVIQEAAGLTYSCSSVRERYVRYGAQPNKLYQLLNGSAMSDTRPVMGPNIRKQHGIGSDEIIFLCVSRNSRVKGLHLVVKAVEMLDSLEKPFRVIFIGPGTKELMSSIKEKAILKKVVLIGEVSLMGEDNSVQIPSPVIAKYLFESDVFIAPALSGTFELSTADAMAAALPVIVSSNVGASDVIINSLNGYVFENNNATSLAEAMKRCLDEPQLLRGMGQRNKVLSGQFGWANVVQRLENIYDNVLRNWNEGQVR